MQDYIRLGLHGNSGCGVLQPPQASGPATFASFQIRYLPLSLHCPSDLQLACSVPHEIGQGVAMVRQVCSVTLHAVLHSGQEIITTLAFLLLGGRVRRTETSYPSAQTLLASFLLAPSQALRQP